MYRGRAIYNPGPAAAEYSKWCANFYNWCGGKCAYCFMEKPPFNNCRKKTHKDSIKKSLFNETIAFNIFKKETKKNLESLLKHGILFNFGSDPFLKETIYLNWSCMRYCLSKGIPVKALTKQTWWLSNVTSHFLNLHIGFTLTGHDELEPGCATNAERIQAMKTLKDRGYKTWASIEPIISLDSSLIMIMQSLEFCDHYKIGLLAKEDRKKFLPTGEYEKFQLQMFFQTVSNLKKPIYFKDEFLKELNIDRKDLPRDCVDRNFF